MSEEPEVEPTPEPPPPPAPIKDSILDDVKKVLNISFDYEAFDLDITMHINSAFATLFQLGVGPSEAYAIEDRTNLWSEFFGERKDLNSVKSYVYGYARILFDPPATAHAETALKEVLKEYEWRFRIAGSTG